MYERILAAAVQIAATKGLAKLTRKAVALKIGVAVGSVSYHFATDQVKGMDGLRKAVVDAAIKSENLPIIAAALILRRREVMHLPKELKDRAMLSAA
jgi:AcrR family transcriptional regulator